MGEIRIVGTHITGIDVPFADVFKIAVKVFAAWLIIGVLLSIPFFVAVIIFGVSFLM